MDRKGTRLSLSRKRKRGVTSGRDRNGHEGSENTVMSSDEISVESKENHIEAQDSQEVKKDKFSKVPETPYTHHNNAKKSIATWFKKPCNPKTVSCPMCEKLVVLSKINLHLDNNCESYVGQHSNSSTKPTSQVNGLGNSTFHKDRKEAVSVISDDKTAKSKDCAINAKRSQSSNEISTPLGVCSVPPTMITRDPDVAALEKKSNGMDRNSASCDTLNEGSGDVCDSNTTKQDSSSQIPCAKPVAETEEISTQDDGILSTDQSQCLTEEDLNKNQAEENLENSKEQENKDHEPYYLANFKLVLNNVFSNKDDRLLFNEPDNEIIDTFNGMSPEEQKLYIRLFQRKRGWFRCSKLEYPRISSNLMPILNSLVQKGKVR